MLKKNKKTTLQRIDIQFDGISKYYKLTKFGFLKQKRIILDNIDIELKSGEFTLLSGDNGSGKSTLLRIIAGLLKPDSAQINTGLETLNWKKYHKLVRQQIMYLYQEPYMFDGTVYRNLSYAVKGKHKAHKINHALQWANLEHRKNTVAVCLSGGEKQRVALAQAWLKQPSVLLLDEPTANMDEESRQMTERLIRKFKKAGTSLLIASHDPNHFNQSIDRHLLLKRGKISDITHLNNLDKQTLDQSSNIAIFPQRDLN